MLMTCPRCQTVFQLADEMLPVDVSSVQVKCSRCQMVFSPPVPVSSKLEDELESSAVGETAEEKSGYVPDDSVMPVAGIEAESDGASPDELPGMDESLAEEAQQAPDDGLPGSDAVGVEEVLAAAAENNPSAEDKSEDKTGKVVADDIVFELADDFDDDLSWDIDEDDHEITTAPESEHTDMEGDMQTAMDEEGLSATAVDDGEAETENFSTAADISEKLMPAPADGATRLETGEETPAVVKSAKVHFDNRRTFLFVGLIFVVLSLAVWGGMLLWQKFSIDMEKHLSIVGLESRSYIFSSDKRVIAIRGKLYNTSPKVVGKLKIKGVIVDRQGKVLAEKVTSGGVIFSAGELQNLDGQMVEKLENPAAVVPANGGELPFMLVFYGYPPSASSFHVELAAFSVLKKGKKP